MRCAAILIIILSWFSGAAAAVINVEFKFTPFTGDAAKEKRVETVSGKAKVFINNVVLAEQQIRQQDCQKGVDQRIHEGHLQCADGTAGTDPLVLRPRFM